jgi:hypothetical protein
MDKFTYRVVSRGEGGGFDVEIEGPGGKHRTVPGFDSEHEATAWIVQAQRLLQAAAPGLAGAPRKAIAR